MYEIEKNTNVSKVAVVTNPDKAQSFMLTLQPETRDQFFGSPTMLNGTRRDSNVLDHAVRKQSFALQDDLAYTARTRMRNKEEWVIIARVSSHAALTSMHVQPSSGCAGE